MKKKYKLNTRLFLGEKEKKRYGYETGENGAQKRSGKGKAVKLRETR